VAATSYKFGDYTPYLYKTTDYGKSWTLITNGIPSNYYTRAIRSDKSRKGLLYAGTEWGMFLSFDDGQNWSPFQLNLPVTSIRDLHVRDNDLIAATHGRSFWMIDDLTPLHQLNDAIAGSEFHLYNPDDAYRMQQSGWGRADSKREGENHPNGAIIHYYIKDLKDSDTVRLEILDARGNPIRQYSNKAREEKHDPAAVRSLEVQSGANRFIWDLRYPGFDSFEGMVLYSSPNRGPKAVPGTYRVRLTYNDEIQEETLTVIKDPRLPNTAEDYQEQFDFLMAVREQVSSANRAVAKIRRLENDMEYLKNKTGDYPELQDRISKFESELEVIENNIHMTKNQSRQDPLNYGIRINNRLAFLMADSQRGDYPPTDQAREFLSEVSAELQTELQSLERLARSEVGAINDLVKSAGVPLLSWGE
ncbi:MAG: glycosyl hydrolase, partial [Robiginitalea sp.]